MFVNVVSFLLVFTQLFHSGAGRAAAAQKKISFTVTSGYTLRGVSAFKDIRLPMEVADADDIEEDAFHDFTFVFPAHIVVASNPVQPSFRMYRARSSLDDTPLFLLHCNFRV